jgi:hypothetical protein
MPTQLHGTWKAASLSHAASFQARVDPTMTDIDGMWTYGEELARYTPLMHIVYGNGSLIDYCR